MSFFPQQAADSPSVGAAADRLLSAYSSGVPCAPVRDLIGRDDLAAAYAVQELQNEARRAAGARVVGRKIGATSEAVQLQLGVDQPDFGVLFDDMERHEGDLIDCSRLLQPRVEAEVAFILSEDLDEGPLDIAQVRGAIECAVAAIEIVDSRIENWDISFADTVADSASSGLYVLGVERKTLDEIEPRDVEMSLSIDGDVASTGNGAACLGDPMNAVAWLAHQARTFGEPLRRGQVILSGALGPMREVGPGLAAVATVSGLGTVTAKFADPLSATGPQEKS